MLRIASIKESTRPGGKAKAVAEWVYEIAWLEAVASFDGYVFVTPEYNRVTGGGLKSAIDFLYHEWRDKAATFVGYGYTMGARAIASLRLTMAAMPVATVRPAVGISLLAGFEKGTTFKPTELQDQFATTLLDHVIGWSDALQSPREPSVGLLAGQRGERG
jgi:NAD(P)H-dependent FMN reductase